MKSVKEISETTLQFVQWKEIQVRKSLASKVYFLPYFLILVTIFILTNAYFLNKILWS